MKHATAQHQVGAIDRARFGQDMRDMGIGRTARDDQVLSDGRIGEAAHDEPHDLKLARRQVLERTRPPSTRRDWLWPRRNATVPIYKTATTGMKRGHALASSVTFLPEAIQQVTQLISGGHAGCLLHKQCR
jgi:hypothetical protein